MNERVIETLAAVGLTFLGSVIIMLVGNWLHAWREARRIADQRLYEWVKERVDKIEPYISRLSRTSYELVGAAKGVLHWTLVWWQTPGSERPQRTGEVERNVNALKETLERADALRKETPEIIFGSLKPQILDGVYALIKSFDRLCRACHMLLSERGEASRQASNSNDLSTLEAWKERWDDEIFKEYAIFEQTYMGLVDAMGYVLALDGYRPPSLLERLRRALWPPGG